MTKCLRMDAKNTIDLKYGTHTKCMTINSTWETELTLMKEVNHVKSVTATWYKDMKWDVDAYSWCNYLIWSTSG
jgi:hypothetical protein